MDIVKISRAKKYEDAYSVENSEGLPPVVGIRSRMVSDSPDIYHDYAKWDLAYRVTISPKGRRKYEESLVRNRLIQY
jgi:hypothetical protein